MQCQRESRFGHDEKHVMMKLVGNKNMQMNDSDVIETIDT